MSECAAPVIYFALIGICGVLIGAWYLRRCEGCHHAARLQDRTTELNRAYARIDALERMMDDARATRLNVPAPPLKDATAGPAALPDEVLAELDMIDDPAVRAEMEADIRIEIAAHPDEDPLAIAQRMIGG